MFLQKIFTHFCTAATISFGFILSMAAANQPNSPEASGHMITLVQPDPTVGTLGIFDSEILDPIPTDKPISTGRRVDIRLTLVNSSPIGVDGVTAFIINGEEHSGNEIIRMNTIRIVYMTCEVTEDMTVSVKLDQTDIPIQKTIPLHVKILNQEGYHGFEGSVEIKDANKKIYNDGDQVPVNSRIDIRVVPFETYRISHVKIDNKMYSEYDNTLQPMLDGNAFQTSITVAEDATQLRIEILFTDAEDLPTYQVAMVTPNEKEGVLTLYTKDYEQLPDGSMVREGDIITVVATPNSGYEVSSINIGRVAYSKEALQPAENNGKRISQEINRINAEEGKLKILATFDQITSQPLIASETRPLACFIHDGKQLQIIGSVDTDWALYDCNGTLIMHSNSVLVDTDKLTKGLYLFMVGTQSQKLYK